MNGALFCWSDGFAPLPKVFVHAIFYFDKVKGVVAQGYDVDFAQFARVISFYNIKARVFKVGDCD